MRIHFHTALRRCAPVWAAVAAFAAAPAPAQEQQAPAPTELSPVEINSKKNAGDVPYKTFYGMQALLQSFQPPEPRVIDLRLRLDFAGADAAARDAYLPDTWAVAVVGDTVDQVVPVSRGGYFVLPELKQAAEEKATIMFNTQTRKGRIDTAWKLRIAEGQTLSYASFAQAFEDVKFVQRQIPWYRLGLRGVRIVGYDGLRACFLPEGGRIEVDGKPAATTTDGGCQVLKYDPSATRASEARIAFIGPLDTVTLHEMPL